MFSRIFKLYVHKLWKVRKSGTTYEIIFEKILQNYILTEKRTFLKWKFKQAWKVFKPVQETANQFCEFVLTSIGVEKNEDQSSKPIIPPFVQLHKEHQEKLDSINKPNKNS